MSTIPQSCRKSRIVSSFPHFLLYFRKNQIHWKSLWFSSPRRYVVDKNCAPAMFSTPSDQIFYGNRSWKRHFAQKCVYFCLRMRGNRRQQRRESSVPHFFQTMLTPMIIQGTFILILTSSISRTAVRGWFKCYAMRGILIWLSSD